MIYLDNAATSYPKPRAVYSTVSRVMRKYGGNPGRGSHRLARTASDALYDLRETAGDFFACDPERVVFCSNATHALNLAIFGLVREPCHVLMSDMEHNSTRRPILSLCRHMGCSCSVFPSCGGDREAVLGGISRLIREDTRLVVVNHVSNVCGVTLPVRAICKYCKKRGIKVVIDASQSAGHLQIDMSTLGADAVCMSGHKGLYGPAGTGLLLLGDDVYLSPMFYGGSGMDSLAEGMPESYPERLEAGTLSAPLAAGLAEGIRFVRGMGTHLIHDHECRLARLLCEYLADMERVQLYGAPFENAGGTVLFNVNGYTPAQVGILLDEVGICVRSGLHCAPLAHRTLSTGENGAVRASFGYFNTVVDVRRLADEVYRLIKCGG